MENPNNLTRRDWLNFARTIIILFAIFVAMFVLKSIFKPDTTEIQNKLDKNKSEQTANEAKQATLDTSATQVSTKAKKAAKRRVNDAVRVVEQSNEFKPSGSDSAAAEYLYKYGKK